MIVLMIIVWNNCKNLYFQGIAQNSLKNPCFQNICLDQLEKVLFCEYFMQQLKESFFSRYFMQKTLFSSYFYGTTEKICIIFKIFVRSNLKKLGFQENHVEQLDVFRIFVDKTLFLRYMCGISGGIMVLSLHFVYLFRTTGRIFVWKIFVGINWQNFSFMGECNEQLKAPVC